MSIDSSIRLPRLLTERRSPEAQRLHRRIGWEGAFTSLWAPLTILAISLIPYLLVVELSRPSAKWAQPLMQRFAFLMVVYFGALAALRLILPSFRNRRRRRHEAGELLTEVSGALRRSQALDAGTREKVVAQASALDARRLSGDAEGMKAEAQKLTDLAEKHLSHFRKTPTADLIVGLAKALAVALLIRAVLIEPYRIPSGSMIPTLEVGDQIFVNKFIYGVRVPFVNWVPFVIVRPPERGDVIVFNNPVDTSEDFIKRVAGVPGDVVELKDSVVYVNGVPQSRELLQPDYGIWDVDKQGDWYPLHGQLYEENLNGRRHLALKMNRPGLGGPLEGPYRVPPGHVFVMGDNRNASLDSRYGLGSAAGTVEYVPFGNIKGKAMIIWLSLAHGGLFSNITGGAGLRTDRLFQPVR